MNCSEVQLNLPAYQAKTLGQAALATLEMHLTGCLKCQKESRTVSKLWSALATLPAIQPSPVFRSAFWQRVREEETKTSWFSFARFGPVVAGFLGVWTVGVSLGITLFMYAHKPAVEWPMPSASLTGSYLRYTPRSL